MKFRNYKDPLYYDANANDKIFVSAYMVSIYNNATTLFQEEDLTEE